MAPILMVLAILALIPLGACSSAEAPAAAPVAEAVSLRVAGYNTWLLPLAAREITERRRRMPEAILAFRPDVVCLQEVWGDGDRQELVRGMAGELPHVARGGGGLLTLSRFPVVSVRFEAFPPDDRLHWSEKLARKGLLDVVVATPAGEVRIVNSHLSLPRDAEQGAAWEAQFEHLLAHLSRARERPLVLAADLNTGSVARGGALSDDYRRLTGAADLVAADPPRCGEDGRHRPRPSTRRGWPLSVDPSRGWAPDHLLFRRGRSLDLALRSFRLALDGPETGLSDHVLLLAEWVVRPAPGGRARGQD